MGLGASACAEGEPVAAGDTPPRPTHQRVQTRDGVLAADLPVDLVVHRHERAILGTSADGERRVYLRHLPHDAIIRVSGHAKDALIGRGWEIDGEQHYETAIEVRAVHRTGKTRRLRVLWIIERAGRVLSCEGGDRFEAQAELQALLRSLCQAVELEPAPAPDGNGADATGG